VLELTDQFLVVLDAIALRRLVVFELLDLFSKPAKAGAVTTAHGERRMSHCKHHNSGQQKCCYPVSPRPLGASLRAHPSLASKIFAALMPKIFNESRGLPTLLRCSHPTPAEQKKFP